MAPLSTATRALARAVPRLNPTTITAVRCASQSDMTGGKASASYQSPFRGESAGNKIPNFGKYMSKTPGTNNALYGYFMVGTMGAITAAGAKSTIQGE